MGPFSFTGQPNAISEREVGGFAKQLATHMDLENPEHRDYVQRFWKSPTIANKQGLKAVDLFETIEEKNLTTIEQIGECLQAGTDCGSCLPELRGILAST